MRKAEAAGNDDCPVKIKLVAPPLYVLTTQTLDKVITFLCLIVLCLFSVLSLYNIYRKSRIHPESAMHL